MNIFMNSVGLQEGSTCISSGVSLGDFVYISAQTGEGDTIQEQVLTACNKVIEVLAHFGLEMRHVVKFTMYVKDLNQKEAILNIFKNFVEAPFPAMSIVQVQDIENHAMLSMEAFAVDTLRYEEANKQHSCGQGCNSCSGGCSHS